MAGFAAAVAVHVFDEPGFDIDWKEAPKKLAEAQASLDGLAARIEKLKGAALREFMQLDLLQERFSGRRGGVGRYERELFRRGFATMIRNADRLRNLGPCWRAS